MFLLGCCYFEDFMLPWLRYILIAVLLVIQLLTLIGVLASSRANTEGVLRDHARVVMHHLIESAAENSLRFVQPAERSAQLTMRMLQEGVFDLNDNAKLERYFLAQLQSQDQLNGMYLAKPNGEFLFVKRDANGFLTKDIRLAGGRVVRLTSRDRNLKQIVQKTDLMDRFDPRTRPWYLEASKAKQQIWTGPYVFFTSKKPGVTSAIPIQSTNGRLLGVVGIDVEITKLSDFIERIPISEHGQAFIMDQSGSAVSFPNLAQILLEESKKTDQPALPKIENIGNEAVQTLIKRSNLTALGSNRNFFEFEAGKTLEYGMLSPFSIGYGTKWLIGLHAPVSDFTGEINARASRYIWQVVGISLLTWLLAIPLAFRITKPLSTLMRQASVDSLTGLLNRAEFIKRANAQIQVSRRNRQPVTVALLDLDGFKGVNDFWGHQAGDEVLTIAAHRISNSLRASDLIGRLGGDEFAMLLPGVSPKEASHFLERVRAAIYDAPIVSSAGEHYLGATIGVAFVTDESNIETVIAKADTMLLSGKSAGKNQIRTAIP
jgi:diguanylate cyclase (GGDEF)-like protein